MIWAGTWIIQPPVFGKPEHSGFTTAIICRLTETSSPDLLAVSMVRRTVPRLLLDLVPTLLKSRFMAIRLLIMKLAGCNLSRARPAKLRTTSSGIIVILRRARQIIPAMVLTLIPKVPARLSQIIFVLLHQLAAVLFQAIRCWQILPQAISISNQPLQQSTPEQL